MRQLAGIIVDPHFPRIALQEDQVAADEGPSRASKRVRKHQSIVASSPSKLLKMDHTAGECIQRTHS